MFQWKKNFFPNTNVWCFCHLSCQISISSSERESEPISSFRPHPTSFTNKRLSSSCISLDTDDINDPWIFCLLAAKLIQLRHCCQTRTCQTKSISQFHKLFLCSPWNSSQTCLVILYPGSRFTKIKNLIFYLSLFQ